MTQAVADVDIGGFKITNAGAPSIGTDLVTKAYVDGAFQGINTTLDQIPAPVASVSMNS